jgi:hypothetical protein
MPSSPTEFLVVDSDEEITEPLGPRPSPRIAAKSLEPQPLRTRAAEASDPIIAETPASAEEQYYYHLSRALDEALNLRP